MNRRARPLLETRAMVGDSRVLRIAVVAALGLSALASSVACGAPELERPTLRRGVSNHDESNSGSGDAAVAPTTTETAAPPTPAPAPGRSATPDPAPAPKASPARTDQLVGHQRLLPGDKLVSKTARAEAVYQTDGNFVVYGPSGALWATNTGGQPLGELSMQDDGNFVLSSGGAALWSTNTAGNAGATVVIQDDCNLVVYASSGQALWASFSLCS